MVEVHEYDAYKTLFAYMPSTVKPLKGHLRTQAVVPYSDVVLYWEVL